MSDAPRPPDPLAPLLEEARMGERAALSRLLRALGPQVLRVARGVLGGGHPDLEDAAQESLVAIAAALPSFRGECGVTHFACRIAARKCVAARLRSRNRQQHREAIAAGQAPLASAEPGLGTTRSARRDALLELLDTLPPEQAETMVLRIVMGFSLAEVADATGAPVNTVRSRLRLSKEALRHRIESDPRLRETLEVGT